MSQQITTNGVYQLIERVSQSEPYINKVRASDYWLEETESDEHPTLIVDVTGGNSQNVKLRRFNVDLYLLSQRREDHSNLKFVISDTRNVLEDILLRLQNKPFTSDYGVRITSEAQYTSITYKGNDKLAGSQSSFQIQVPSQLCLDDLPTTVGVPSVSPVIIYDYSGGTVVTLQPGESYTIPEDESETIIELTKEEYDALPSKDDDTLYIIINE